MDRQANQNNQFSGQATVSEIIHDMVTLTRLTGLTAGEKRVFWVIKRMKSLSEKWFTHVFLIVCLLLYSVLGAVIFMGLEGPHEKKEIKETEQKFLEYIKLREDFMTQVQLTCENTSTVSNSSNIFAELFEKNLNIYEKNVKDYKEFVAINYVPDYKKTWRFWNSMLYAATIYSTIGYGHITPKTMSGRIVTIIYSIIGIPFFLIVLADFGKLLTKELKRAWANTRIIRCKIRKQLERKMLFVLFKTSPDEGEDDNGDNHSAGKPGGDPLESTPDAHIDLESEENGAKTDPCQIPEEEVNDTFDLPVSVALTLLLTYLFLGGAIFTFMEPWSYCDSFYFTFISMSTIGLGDLVPSKPKYMIAFMFYLICGLALMSMCITVVQNKLFVTFNKAQKMAAESLGMRVQSVRK